MELRLTIQANGPGTYDAGTHATPTAVRPALHPFRMSILAHVGSEAKSGPICRLRYFICCVILLEWLQKKVHGELWMAEPAT